MTNPSSSSMWSDKSNGSTDNVEFIDLKKNGEIHIVETLDSSSSTLPSVELDLHAKPPSTARELVTEVISTDDDPSLNPWTFRMWFIGIGISVFAGTLTTINIFRPQSLHIHLVFVAVLSHIIGNLMHKFLPSRGRIGRILNPGPFNKKEHVAICVMCSAAGSTPEAMMVLAVQRLYYGFIPSAGVGIFLILSTQMLGYGVAGLLRTTLVYPSKMLYPVNLPVASLLENLHRDRRMARKRMKVFYIGFFIIFAWQAFPQYLMPILGGVSIFCLANQNSLLITNLFGGVMANEGLGLFSLSFDWSMLTSGGNPLWMPLRTLMNHMGGYLLSVGIYMALYYGNIWKGRQFPFLSPLLFSERSTSERYVIYDQLAILNKNHEVDHNLLQQQGLPFMSSSHAFSTTTINIAITAAISHIALFHWNDIKSAFAFLNSRALSRLISPRTWDLRFWNHSHQNISDNEAEAIDPHYRVMQAYDEVPTWWYGAIWIVSVVIGMVTSQMAGSNLPWWAFLFALFLAALLITFFGALTAMYGYFLLAQPLIQMLGAYILPGKPVANMYFATFGFNSMYQSNLMLKDLKLGQYCHLAPRCTFAMQMIGTAIGCIMSYGMMVNITETKRDILLSIQGSNVWSGQLLQAVNSAAITWGALAKYLYSAGGRYPWVSYGFVIGLLAPIPLFLGHRAFPRLRLDYFNVAIIMAGMGTLALGTHSSMFLHYVIGFASQFYLRRYRSAWFLKYNYILSAALDGGAAVISFILTFTVFGAGGKVVPFPPYWGNNWQKGNYDFCMRDPGLGSRVH